MSIHQDGMAIEPSSSTDTYREFDGDLGLGEYREFSRFQTESAFPHSVQTPGRLSADLKQSASSVLSIGTESKLGRIQLWKDVKTSVPLILADMIAVLVCFFVSNQLAYLNGIVLHQSARHVLGIVGFVLLVQHIHGLYPACGITSSIEFRRILRTCLIVTSGYFVGILAKDSLHPGTLIGFFFFSMLLVLFMPTARALARKLFSRWRWWTQPILVVGSGPKAEALFHRLQKSVLEGVRPVGIAYDPNAHWSSSETYEKLYIGPANDLESILLATKTCRVAVADHANVDGLSFSSYCGIPHVTFPSQWQQHPSEKVRFAERNGQLELHCFQTINSSGALIAKRFMDVGLIVLATPILIPLFVTIGLVIKFSSKGAVFYNQNRIGRGGKEFKAWKFRSMVQNADKVLHDYLAKHPDLQAEWERDHKLKNDPRVTSIGRILRKTSLDELPQLWNVLVGEMSLVGPRPIVRDEVAKYGEIFKVYKLVRPGITGLWQISGRNNTTYDERLYFDRFYVQNWSCMLDVFILWRTIKTALFQEGAY